MVSNISGCTLEKAMSELREDPERRVEMISELRDKLMQWKPNPDDPYEEGLTLDKTKIGDDSFLLRFLRARKFDVERACKLFVNYFKYRAKYSSTLGEISPTAVETTLKANIVSVLPHRSKDGCKVLVARMGNLDIEVNTLDKVLQMMLVILDKLIEDEETQVHGIIFCEDLAGLTLYTMLALARQEQVVKGKMFELIQDAFPARFKGFHVLNQPWYISILMAIVRPFMKQKTKDRLHMHGSDYDSLHQFLAPEHLPVEFGGQLETLDTHSAYHIFNY